MDPIQLISLLLALYLLFHGVGSWLALKRLIATIKVEKLAKSWELDYNIRYKKTMFVICIVFSWLAYSAIRKLGVDNKENDDVKR